MAPGCYAPSSSALESASSNNSIEQQHQDASLSETSFVKLAAIKLDTTSSSTTQSSIFNQIPLPLTPPPPRHRDNEDEEEDESDDESSEEEESDDEEEAESSESSSDEEDEEVEELHKQDEDEKKEKPADTFEILEQTIMKQKRLAKLKNTDLRRKVLLKRTFDRVLEIMDAENGFNDDLDTPPTQQVVVIEPPTVTIEGVAVADQPMESALELELHPDPSSQMDDIDEHDSSDSDDDTSGRIDDATDDMETTTSTTEIESARVPRRHLKRRSSASDDDEEDDDEEEENQLDDDFYECYYDQQLNYRRSKLDRHQERRSDGLYSDTTHHHLRVVRVNSKSAEAANSKRSNHQRKKLKPTSTSA